MCFNFDAENIKEIANEVIGTERLNIKVNGVAAHASTPAKGVSAAVILSEAVAELESSGWNGEIEKHEGSGTANLGILKGGKGSNVVMPELYGLAEARSIDLNFRRKIIKAWKEAFLRAVERSNERAGCKEEKASVEFSPDPAYDPYRLPEDAPVVQAAISAAKKCGLIPRLYRHLGGMDSNNIVSKGIPAVGLGMGSSCAHSMDEWVDIDQFLKACELGVKLAEGER